MKRILFCATSMLAISTSVAFAQDTGHDWNGWYIGAQLGASQHKPAFEDRDFGWLGSTLELQSLGGSIGVTSGYNFVDGNTLVGVATDLSYLSHDDKTPYAGDVRIQNEADLLATLRARAGHVVDDTLIYTTLGLAYANFERSWTENGDVPDSWPDMGNGKTGVVLGFGLEQAVTNRLSVAGSFQTSVFDENPSTNSNGFTMYVNDRIHTFGIAVNYQLGDVADSPGATAATGSPADFSGPYVGGQIGAAFADISSIDILYDYDGGKYDVGNTGATRSVAGGYNWQLGATVLGVEAKYTAADIDESFEDDFGNRQTGIDQIISLRGRAGVAVGDTQLYVLGGISQAEVKNTFDGGAVDVGGTYKGLTVGTGVEQFATGNLSWTVEASYTLFDGVDIAPAAFDAYSSIADLTEVSAGVNYYFGGRDRSAGSGAMAPTHDWSGAYAGFDLGLMGNTGSMTDIDYAEHGGTIDLVSLGAGLGGHAGYNWQNGSLVYGVVADVTAYNNDGSKTAENYYREFISSIDAMGTLRGRAGIATGDSLYFATAGLGAVQSELEYNYAFSPEDDFDLSETRLGAVVGLGVEHALSERMRLKVETLYYASDVGDYAQDPVQDCSGPSGFDGGDCSQFGSDTNLTIKAGMSFTF